MIILNTETESKEIIEKRLEDWLDAYNRIKDKESYAYLQLLDSMRMDYEKLGDIDNCIKICKEIESFCIHTSSTKPIIEKMLLASYDSRARCGDFRAYCVALEWNRPINKQFFLPRKKILEKHGLIQAMQDMSDDKLDFLFISLPPRIGKLVNNSTPILTKQGWKKHGDLQVGDYVLNSKGRFVKVLATSPEYPCNRRITFANGEQIDCHENHEWVVYDNSKHTPKLQICETNYIERQLLINHSINSKGHGRKYRFTVPYTKPIVGDEKILPVKPYSLGVWLGNGDNRRPRITQHIKDKIVLDSVGKEYPISNHWDDIKHNTYNIYCPLLGEDLKKVNMCIGKETRTKHIPEIYLTASFEQRLQLLAGLLDTDGYLNKKEHNYQYVSVDKELIDDFCTLVSSFGWNPCVRYQEPHTTSSGIVGRKRVYTVKFRPTFEIPCRLERKQLKDFSKQRRITITNIEEITNGEMGKCIQVEGGIYLVGKTLIPTHNSTLGLFFLTFRAGLYPDMSILGNGHSASLTQSFYQECLNIMTSDEYRYKEIFRKNDIAKQSAEYTWIDLGREKRFHTLMFRSVDGGTTGLAEASNLLYCDDLIKDIEQANNPDRLDKLFETYTSTIQDRKIQRLCKDGVYRPCPEIHIATRWSLRDPIGRLMDIYGEEDSDRIRVINIPCYDENGESNFLYDYGKGFSKEYYHHLQMAEVPEVFAAKYLGEPVERDGLVFTENTLTYYNELPEGKPDRIVAYGDVTHGGADYFSLPIGYVYGCDVYIEDIFFEHNFGGDDYSRPRVCDTLIRNNVTKCGFESNNGGDFYSSLISQDLKMKNYRCNITTHTAKTNKSKMDRILACQNEIKGTASESNTYRIYFKDKEARKNNPQYCAAMRQLFSWNQNPSAQKKQHDDFPDSLAGMITNVLGGKQKGVARSDRKLVY